MLDFLALALFFLARRGCAAVAVPTNPHGVPADFTKTKPVNFEPWNPSDATQVTYIYIVIYVCGN